MNTHLYYRIWLLSVCLLASTFSAFAQVNVLWDKTIGGSENDFFSRILSTSDGGYLLAGDSRSDISEDKSEDSRGMEDYWVVKVDADGNKQWDKTYGGNYDDNFTDAIPTSNGGYLLGGTSISDASGEKSENSAGYKFWIIKIDANGNKLWDKTYGENISDELESMISTADGGYLLAGSFFSFENNGEYDYLVIKIDANGNKQWEKSYGGNTIEFLSNIIATSDGGYLLAGRSESNASGDKSENSKGGMDYWIIKIDADGNMIWDKTLGGDRDEFLSNIIATTDGGYLLAGSSPSNISGDKSEDRKGGGMYDNDFWLVKIDANGNKVWDKTIGGNSVDALFKATSIPDEGYLLAGRSDSPVSGDKSENSKGGADYWIVKTDANGNKQWDKTVGGSDSDILRDIVPTADEGYLLAGYSSSNKSGDKSEDSKGERDYWLVKVVDNQAPMAQLTATPDSGPAPLTVHFDASGSMDEDGEITSYDINYGDNHSAIGPHSSFTYTYERDGFYTVTLTVTDNQGATGSTTQQITVGDPPGIAFRLIDADTDRPVLNLYDGYFASFFELPTNMAIEAISRDPVGSIRIEVTGPGIQSARNQSDAPYSSFGDENGDFKGMPAGVGVYHVKATPYSGRNATGVPGEPVEISFGFLEAPVPPVAHLIASPSLGSVPLTVFFDASGSTDEDGEIIEYFFDFGDGTSIRGAAATVTHTYAAAGEYEVRLNIRDDNGGGSGTSTLVTVVEEPTPGTAFRLIDAQTDAVITNLSPGTLLSAPGLPESLAIEVVPAGPVGSFKIRVVGPDFFSTKNESAAPFSSFGDDNGDFFGRELGVGTYTVTATPYSGRNATGVPGIPVELSFEIAESAPDLRIAGFKLIDAQQNTELFDGRIFTNRLTVNTTEIPQENLGIEVIPAGPVGSIQVAVEGPGISTTMTENAAPYSAFGDDGNNILGREFSEGTYLITATAYSGRNATGTAGTPAELNLEVESCTPPSSQFTAVPTSGKVPLGVRFTADEDNPDYNYLFDFGDGTDRFVGFSTTHTYTEVGEYTVTLTVTNLSTDCSSFSSQTIVVEEVLTPENVSFRLIDAKTDQPIMDLTDGTQISQASLPSSKLAIEVIPAEPVGSFKIQVNGPGLATSKNESTAPYASFGDDNGDFDGETLTVGTYTVVATPYSGRNATGIPGSPAQIQFQITNGNAWVVQSTSEKKSPENAFVEFGLSNREEGNLLVYPNPAQSYVEVNLPLLDEQAYTLQLYDLYGRLVFRQQGTGSVIESVQLDGQPAGTYLVALETQGQRMVKKLLIDK